MLKAALVTLSLVVVVPVVHADIFGCSQSAPRRLSASTTGISRIVVIGRAGTLKVSGRSDARDVVATGTACADDKTVLSDVRGDFTVQSKGSGSVDYERVGGRVSVPRKHRD